MPNYAGARIFEFIVAHGAREACLLASIENQAGSLAIAYGHNNKRTTPQFYVELDRKNPVHVLDSENLEIIFNELDTIYDFTEYFEAKETALSKLDYLMYAGEEELLAFYFRNFNRKTNRHYINIHYGKKKEPINGLWLDQGFWEQFIKNKSYQRKQEADEISHLWDDLIQCTSKHIFDGTALGNSNAFEGKSAIFEMAKEPRFSRRALSEHMQKAVENFPTPTADNSLVRNVSFMPSFYENKAYIFLQLFAHNTGDYETEYRPRRQKILELACGCAKNRYPYLKKIIGIAVEAPKFSQTVSEDLLLMECDDWTSEQSRYYKKQNKDWRFFETENLTEERKTSQQFPDQPGRNDPCYCGSGIKYKKCHGTVIKNI